MKSFCVLLALTSVVLFLACGVSLLLKAWSVAALCYIAGSLFSFALMHFDQKFHPRGLPVPT
jgi:hypothetical protein